MTSAEEVPRTPFSVGARQAEPPALKNGLVHVFLLKRATLTGRISTPQASQGTHKWSARSMTSAEEVPRIPSSIGARQAEPPAPQNGLVYVFSRGGTIPQ